MTFTADLDPMVAAIEWMDDAKTTAQSPYPDAACLCTVSPDGYPEGRIVLVRKASQAGFDFFTNGQSWKGVSLTEYPKATLNFYWESLHRQLRITGDVSPVSDAESDDYFSGRPRISQLGAWASQQSEPLGARETLEAAVARYDAEFKDQPVPRPPHWHGFRVTPIRIEFWIEGPYRLHNRFLYVKTQAGDWRFSRLNP